MYLLEKKATVLTKASVLKLKALGRMECAFLSKWYILNHLHTLGLDSKPC